MARLGHHEVNPAFGIPETPSKYRAFHRALPWLLPGVVAAAALLVGLFLASLIRQVRGRLRPPE